MPGSLLYASAKHTPIVSYLTLSGLAPLSSGGNVLGDTQLTRDDTGIADVVMGQSQVGIHAP
jgi:hypothetical protein